MRLREFSETKNDFVDMFRKFLPIAVKVLDLPSLPQFVFDKELDTGSQPSFGMYDSDNQILYVALANRHPVDILRTIAHELVHYRQDLNNELEDDSGMTGSPHENQANELAGVILRHFNKQNPDFLKIKPLLLEASLFDPVPGKINTGDFVTFDGSSETWKVIAVNLDRTQAKIKSQDSGMVTKFSTDKLKKVQPPKLEEKQVNYFKHVDEKLNRTSSNELVIFDIDDTLLHTTAQIKVIKDGKPVKSLTNQEFNNYKLGPGEEFDFGEFRNAQKFEEESVPIGPMLDKLRDDLSSGKNVVMLTARSDFDNQKAVWRTFKRHGIDINKDVHLFRAGNLPGNGSPAVKKAIHVSTWLDTGNYNKIVMYDDSEKNLAVFKSLQKRFPEVEFEAHHVSEEGETRQVESWSKKYKQSINCNNPKGFSQRAHCQGRKKNEDTDLEERKRKKKKVKAAAYGPGPYGWYGYSGEGDSGGIEEEQYDQEAEEYRAKLIKQMPHMMKFLDQAVKGWRPNEEQMMAAIETAYTVMKHTGNIKQAGKAMMDELNSLHKMSQDQQGMAENFADGKNPGRKGLAKRSGVPTKASVSRLRQIAKSSSGEKARMAHWLANMKAGRKK